MPGFIGHSVANGVVLVGVSAYMLADKWSVADIAWVDAGILVSTLVLSPDMDLFTSKPIDGWGLMRWFWWPYAKFVKHRDVLHFPLLGTAVRWLYLLIMLALLILPILLIFRQVGLQVNFNFTGDRDDVIWYSLYLADIFVGACIADAVHYILDVVTHEIKMAVPWRRRRARAVSPENSM